MSAYARPDRTVSGRSDQHSSYDHYVSEGRSHLHQVSNARSGNPGQSTAYPREVPRYDPTISRLSIPQLLSHGPSEGGAGTTFSVQVTNISHDPRVYRFVFGQQKVSTFLERSRTDNDASVLVAQVPTFRETSWWSNRVPVYLLITDGQTDENIHSMQICEFYYNESSSPRKRAREEIETLQVESALKRPSAQPSYVSDFNALPAPAYQSPYSQENSYVSGHRQTQSQSYRQPMTSNPIPYSTIPVQPYNRAPRSQERQYHPGSAFSQQTSSQVESGNLRYIAEPQDQRSDLIRPAQDFRETPVPFSARPGQRSPGSAPVYYQGSIASSPATWRSPGHTAGANVYVSPPPSSSLSKAETPYDNLAPLDDGEDLHAPVLQRTSTLSSSSNRATTPAKSISDWLPSNRAKLELLGDLDDMSRNWSADEFGIRRRLVQFWRRQEGNVVKLNFRPVEPGSVRPPHAIIISCIYWEERQECFFTSVDAIHLLESVVGNKFSVEEKNRIRRNLEGFKPLTVSKGKLDCENFFKLIMGFPVPKPRNIEKDVKAFPWRILTSALRKIIGKYSASYEGLTEASASSEAPHQESHQEGRESSELDSSHTRMPPPTLHSRMRTNESPLEEKPKGGLLADVRHDSELPHFRGFAGAVGPDVVKSQAPSPPRSAGGGGGGPAAGLSIQVPPRPSDSLPVLDGAAPPATSEFERRPSAAGGSFFPLSGISNVDFSDFFQSPGIQPTTGSAWPSLNSLFPPPSAGLGPDNTAPRKQ